MSNHNTPSRAIVFYPDKAKILNGSLPSLYGILLILPIVAYRHSTKRVVKAFSVFLGGLFLLFESLFIPSFYRLLFHVPSLIVNENGFTLSLGGTWLIDIDMSIRWEEIAALYINEITTHGKKRTRTNRLLAVIPKDEDAFFQREKMLRPNRFPIWGALSLTKTPFMLFEQLILPTTLETLLAQISTQYNDKIQANGIEIREEQKTVSEGKRS